jgi:hypothetical protein
VRAPLAVLVAPPWLDHPLVLHVLLEATVKRMKQTVSFASEINTLWQTLLFVVLVVQDGFRQLEPPRAPSAPPAASLTPWSPIAKRALWVDMLRSSDLRHVTCAHAVVSTISHR